MSCDEWNEFQEDSVDPRVQVELERLNVATDEINRLEVDLDECRSNFRILLNESSTKIENCSKQLGGCIAKARPYYDARLKAKEALKETQKMASKFERANSAHAAAKEMVFLAEEGLQAEGRTFDHAWQEMLNHATMRVNESEADRTVCEAEHKRASQFYHLAETRVQSLQKSLKKAISKSRAYFELKIHYNQILEEQKNKVKALEKQVSDTKLLYAETLRNLEQISDEIHQTRSHNKKIKAKTGADAPVTVSTSNKELKCASDDVQKHQRDDNKNPVLLTASESTCFESKVTPTSGSSLPDTDVWSETSEAGISGDLADRESNSSDNDSSLTGIPDSESEDDIKMVLSNTTISEKTAIFEGVGICSFPVEPKFNAVFPAVPTNDDSQWTEIKLSSSGEDDFPLVRKRPLLGTDEDFDIPYAPLSEMEGEAANSTPSDLSATTCEMAVLPGKIEPSANVKNDEKDELGATCVPTTPRKMMNIRRQSLDVLWNAATGEKMKEILSQGIFKLNIGSINERRNSKSKNPEDEKEDVEEAKGANYEANLSNQFGLQFFCKKPKPDDDIDKCGDGADNQNLVPKKETFFSKTVPRPLERTLSFLNPDDDSMSDSDSLPSMDMLTDEQLTALVLDQDLTELYRDILQ